MRNYEHEDLGDNGSDISDAETYIINDDRNIHVSRKIRVCFWLCISTVHLTGDEVWWLSPILSFCFSIGVSIHILSF